MLDLTPEGINVMNKGIRWLTKNVFFALWINLMFISCQSKESNSTETLFQKIDSSFSGLTFRNDLEFDEKFNIFTYRNFYNGGGTALGDINNDGLLDIYLTSNMGQNKLYLNEGNFKFKDVTEESGTAGTRAWSTGVAFADINGDGFLDIYVCNSGDIEGDNKQNELFINKGDGTFKEMAEAYGLADQGYSTHAAFFDYDNDGDLDVYLLNNSYQAIGSFNKMQNERPKRDPVGGDKLFRNDGEKFTDVSEQAGIFGSVIGFGLGITIGDVNRDGWMDIFISNDFFERDYLYINNQNGTFSEKLTDYMRSTSAASMGADIADIDNNGYLDIFVTEMLPEPLQRVKQITTFESWDKFQFNVTHGYHYQYTRNMLHVNNGDGSFSEMGRLANIEATDWSWAALIFDMDNDGLKDLFVSNGIYQDLTDLDYLNFIDNEETKKKLISQNGVNFKALVDPIPINPVSNYAFKNKDDLIFENLAHEWGLGDPVHSNGSAYGDLNNDGAMDLIINNVNNEVLLFKNRSREFNPENHFLKVHLEGRYKNTAAIGAQVKLVSGDEIFYQENIPNRGFQSSVDPTLHFGLGETSKIDELQVRWPDGKITVLEDIAPDQTLILKWEEGIEPPSSFKFFQDSDSPIFSKETKPILSYIHEENYMVDFDRDRLTYHMLSTEGPKATWGDIDKDGLEDVYIGGAKGFAGQLFKQKQNGTFKKVETNIFENDKFSEDTDALFFDANSDGTLDLLVSSGGNESGFGSPDLADRLYLNDGKGDFKKAEHSGLSSIITSTSVVKTIDINDDGHLDLFVGSRVVPFAYGVNPSSYILVNDGTGKFQDGTPDFAPELKEIGMVTDASIVDYDGDGIEDLVIVGEWMAPTFFKNTGSKLEKASISEINSFKGWYQSIEVGDFNNDGKPDFVLGNHGLNTRFKATIENPIKMFVNDFDQNGSIEHLFAIQDDNGKHIPFTLKHELERQIPSIKKRFLKYNSYNDKYLEDIFNPKDLKNSIIQEINYLSSAIMINQGNGKFQVDQLPRMAQRSWIYTILITDVNVDGIDDLIMGGNLRGAKPEVGQYDASYGEVLIGKGDGTFEFMDNRKHGLKLEGDIRDLHSVIINDQKLLQVVKNNASVEFWKY